MIDLAYAVAATVSVGAALAALTYGAWAIAVDDWTPHLRGGRLPEHRHEDEREDDDAPDIDRGDGDGEQRVSPLGLDDAGHGRQGGREDGLGVGGRHAADDKSQNDNDRGIGGGTTPHPHLEPHEHLEPPEPALQEEDGLGG